MIVFPPVEQADESGVVALGGDLEPETLLTAYRSGLFPMPVTSWRGAVQMAWWSPDPRGILWPDDLRVSRSLRQSCRRYEVRVNTAFVDVLAACAHPSRPHGWITQQVGEAYVRMHQLGHAHSVEAWNRETGELAGGLYGVAIGGLFAGESMFFRQRDASKVALVELVRLLRDDGRPGRIIDVQWLTAHLATLGAIEIPRARYLGLLERALDLPRPAALRARP